MDGLWNRVEHLATYPSVCTVLLNETVSRDAHNNCNCLEFAIILFILATGNKIARQKSF